MAVGEVSNQMQAMRLSEQQQAQPQPYRMFALSVCVCVFGGVCLCCSLPCCVAVFGDGGFSQPQGMSIGGGSDPNMAVGEVSNQMQAMRLSEQQQAQPQPYRMFALTVCACWRACVLKNCLPVLAGRV